MDLAQHVVVLGYSPGRTDRMLTELIAEGRTQTVLCAWNDVAQHPVPELREVSFVRGDLTPADVMTRAGVARARTVVVDGRDGNGTLAIAAAVDHADPGIHMVAALRDLTRRECLPSGHRFATFGDVQVHLGRTVGATVLAVRGEEGLVVSPPWDTSVAAGTTVYYVGKRRITDRELISAR
ncbi:hypothetical protein SAMN05661080_04063 [Modestobacter sp. DSM 44400]|uniref:hypothetical protein n=1 Tax=Modestobacter sp. DSM 44400 TaxID=1550230 RepID=UPI00089C88E9|nr:hypothetical protein [Modestobacter sp. DSM 44400]SDY61891.1 hypothetical protein SAMN05661080_04063 [Modestobacter sp. DSM 44400]